MSETVTLGEPSNDAGTLVLGGHRFDCYAPRSSAEQLAWLLVVSKGNGEVVHREMIPMQHPPIFDPHIDDVVARDRRVGEIVQELGLAELKAA